MKMREQKAQPKFRQGEKKNEAKAALENGPTPSVPSGPPKRMPTNFGKGQGRQVKDFSYVSSVSEKIYV